MPNLEFKKYGFNFKNMQENCLQYSNGKHFPKGITIVEKDEFPLFKNEVFNKTFYPETFKKGVLRTMDQFQIVNKRVQEESESDTKSICYLIVSNYLEVDQ